MIFSSKTVETIANQVRDKGIKTIPALQSPNERQVTAILDSFKKDIDPTTRIMSLSASTDNYAIVFQHKFFQVTKPIFTTNKEGVSIVLLNLSQTIGEVIPVSIPASTFAKGIAVTIGPRDTITQAGMHTFDKSPEEIPAQGDASNVNEPNLGSERLQLYWTLNTTGSNEPVFTTIPLVCPIPNGFAFSAGGAPIEEDEVPTGAPFNELRMWCAMMRHNIELNDGKSLNRGGPAFDQELINAHVIIPGIPSDVSFLYSTFVECELKALSIIDAGEQQHYKSVVNVAKEYQSQILLNYANNQGYNVNLGSPSSTSPGANLFGSPESPSAWTGRDDQSADPFSRMTTAIASALEKSNSSPAKESAFKRASTSIPKLRAAFGRTTFDETGTGTFEPATITDVGRLILEASSITAAVSELTNQVHLAIAQAKMSDKTMDNNVSFRPEQIDTALTSSILNYNFLYESMNVNPGVVKSQLTILAFLHQPTQSPAFLERVENNLRIRLQEQVQEDTTKRARKTTELYINGSLQGISILQALSNFKMLFSILFVDFDKCDLWQALSKYYSILLSGRTWREERANHQNADMAILHDVEMIMHPFFRNAMDLTIANAIKEGRTVSAVFQKSAIDGAKYWCNRLAAAIDAGDIGHVYSAMPHFGQFLPQYVGAVRQRVIVDGVHDRRPSPADNGPQQRQRQRPPQQPPRQQHQQQQVSVNQGQSPPGAPVQRITDQARLDSAKRQGFLVYNGPPNGRVPSCSVRANHFVSRTKQKICTRFICQGLACTFVRCSFAHPSRMSVLQSDEQAALKTWVNNTATIEFVSGQAPNGTS
jgi:hypothetical protein